MMKLLFLDIRGNYISIQYTKMFEAFLKDTVVLMWDNPTC